MANERRWMLQNVSDSKLSVTDFIIKHEKAFIKKFLPVHAKEVRTVVGGGEYIDNFYAVDYIKIGYVVKKKLWPKFGETNSVIINQANFDQWRTNLPLINFVNKRKSQ